MCHGIVMALEARASGEPPVQELDAAVGEAEVRTLSVQAGLPAVRVASSEPADLVTVDRARPR
jgi:hypothetical protein